MVERFFVIFALVLLAERSLAKKVVIFDSSEKVTLKWATWSNSPVPKSSREDSGWMEESVTNIQEGMNTRSYVACDVSRDHVDNWLRVDYMPRGAANRLSIDIAFTIRDCRYYPHETRTCKETFSLMYAETDDDEPLDRHFGPQNASEFKTADRITADFGRFSSRGEVRVSHETRSVAVSKKGVYFAFRDEGACISILAVKIFFEVCEELTTQFATFGETPVGPAVTSIQEAIGVCVPHASPPSGARPKYVCKADGTWDLLSGGCQCDPGYRAVDGQRCTACEVGTFKDVPGFGLCQPCADNSRASKTASTMCLCDSGYYRASSDSQQKPCTRPPSRPENLLVASADQTSLVLVWNQPTNLGGRSEYWFRVECRECPPNTQYYPTTRSKLNSTKVTITNLEPSTSYTIFVYAENDVSSLVDASPMYSLIEATTKSETAIQVRNVRVESVSENLVALTWDSAEQDIGVSSAQLASPSSITNVDFVMDEEKRGGRQGNVAYYQIKRFIKTAPANFTLKTSNVPKVTMTDLTENTEYVFEVRPFVGSKGWGEWSEPRSAKTSSRLPNPAELGNDEHKRAVLVGSLATAAIIFVLVLIGVFLIRKNRMNKSENRRRSAFTNEKSTSDLEYNAVGQVQYKSDCWKRSEAQLVDSKFKPYVDPSTYEDPTLALKEFADEVDSRCIIIEEIIGAGEFGEVCKGKMNFFNDSEESVAIKTLKPGSTSKAKLDFLTEASIMGQFDHPNVIRLKGVVTKCEPVMIITEYMQNRSLDKFLRANDGKLPVLQLVAMMRGVALGMKYLSEKGYVHRDLAARNVLVDGLLTCKIADFGLSRTLDCSSENAYMTKGGKIPVRWTAPEALTHRKFTSAADVWSFGVLMWEVMSFGERPYWDWANQTVIQAVVERGYRLPAPMECPSTLHSLMMSCWNDDRTLRPSFGALVANFDGFLRFPNLLCPSSISSSTVQAVVHNDYGGCGAAANLHNLMLRAAGVDDFLRNIGLYERYATTFRHRGIKTTLDLNRLTLKDFSAWGVRREDQEIIFDALQTLQATDHPASMTTMRFA